MIILETAKLQSHFLPFVLPPRPKIRSRISARKYMKGPLGWESPFYNIMNWDEGNNSYIRITKNFSK